MSLHRRQHRLQWETEPNLLRPNLNVVMMQPYFFPYIGYFQLASEATIFIFQDDVKYTKRGWINRNTILRNNSPVQITLPLARSSDSQTIGEKLLAASYLRASLIRKIQAAYAHAPYLQQAISFVDNALDSSSNRMVDVLVRSLNMTFELFGLEAQTILSSSLSIPENLKREQRIYWVCNHFGATSYINSIGGAALYSTSEFTKRGISLRLLTPRLAPYSQAQSEFVPSLSIIDHLMWRDPNDIAEELTKKDFPAGLVT